MHRIARTTASLIIVVVFGLMSVRSHAQDASLAQLPLVTQNNLTYLGFFTLPSNDGSGTQQGDFGYGGRALSVTPEGTLLVSGHTWYSTLCELSIPAIGGTATVLQRCAEVTNGLMNQVDPGGLNTYGGSLPYGGRVILSIYNYYDADGGQILSHLALNRNFAAADAIGPVQVGTAGAGFVSGYMGTIPSEWQTSFGGTALTGNCCIPIISRTSSGPAVSVFNPDDIGRVSPVPATQLIGYPLSTPLADAKGTNPLFTQADMMGGVAFPAGTRSVLFVGRHGAGTPCYGEGTACADAAVAYKGEHAYPYVHQVWAYDANDLLAVRNGTKQPSAVLPYATWQLTEMNNTGDATIRSAFYDQTSNRIYVAEDYGEKRRIHVYQLTVGGSSASSPTAPTTTPTTPTTTAPTTTTPPTTTPTRTRPRPRRGWHQR